LLSRSGRRWFTSVVGARWPGPWIAGNREQHMGRSRGGPLSNSAGKFVRMPIRFESSLANVLRPLRLAEENHCTPAVRIIQIATRPPKLMTRPAGIWKKFSRSKGLIRECRADRGRGLVLFLCPSRYFSGSGRGWDGWAKHGFGDLDRSASSRQTWGGGRGRRGGLPPAPASPGVRAR
jgi:hypothetical protein